MAKRRGGRGEPYGTVEEGRRAGGVGSPCGAGRGARGQRGAKEPPELSESKCLVVALALARDTKCAPRSGARLTVTTLFSSKIHDLMILRPQAS